MKSVDGLFQKGLKNLRCYHNAVNAKKITQKVRCNLFRGLSGVFFVLTKIERKKRRFIRMIYGNEKFGQMFRIVSIRRFLFDFRTKKTPDKNK